MATRVPGFRGRPAGDLLLRGCSEPLRAYEPLPQEGFEASVTDAYTAAFQKLTAGDPTALAAFAALVGTDATDALASFHLRRLLNGQSGTQILLD